MTSVTPGETLEQGGPPAGAASTVISAWGKSRLQPREHRQAHDRIPHPVGGAHQEALHREILRGKFPGGLQLLKTLLHFRGQGLFVRLRRMIHYVCRAAICSAVSDLLCIN